MYHTNWNLYHTDKNGFITHGVYHIKFSKKVKNRVITQPKNIKMKIVQKLKKNFCVIKTFKKIISVCFDHLKKNQSKWLSKFKTRILKTFLSVSLYFRQKELTVTKVNIHFSNNLYLFSEFLFELRYCYIY